MKLSCSFQFPTRCEKRRYNLMGFVIMMVMTMDDPVGSPGMVADIAADSPQKKRTNPENSVKMKWKGNGAIATK